MKPSPRPLSARPGSTLVARPSTEQQLYDALPDALRVLGQDNGEPISRSTVTARASTAPELLGAGQRLLESARDAMGVAQPGDKVIADPWPACCRGWPNACPACSCWRRTACARRWNTTSSAWWSGGRP